MELQDYYLAVKALSPPEGLSKAAGQTWLQINTDKLRKGLTTDQLLLVLKNKSDLAKGERLFKGYTSSVNPYGQILLTAYMRFGEEETYLALAKADSLGKQLALVESTAINGEPTGFRYV